MHIQELLGSRRGWTPVALLTTDLGSVGPKLLELARGRRWRLINLGKFGGSVPENLEIKGVITNILPDHDLTMAVRETGVPMVRIGKWPHPDDHHVPAVIPDHRAAGRLAAEHFAQRDFKHVGATGQNPWGENEETYLAFAARADELGMQSHLLQEDQKVILQIELHTERTRYRRELMARWLESVPRPLGLLAFGSTMADRLVQSTLDFGLSVPQDVAVIGIEDEPIVSECATVPISAITLDYQAIAEATIQTLADLMDGQPLDQTTIRIPPRGIITRQSTDVLAASDPRVASALRYMWEHITEDLAVDEIANHVGVSRRTLEKAFSQDLGRGINQELQRRRLDRACELLRLTELQIGEIAESLNFSSQSQFGRAFRNAYGKTPAKYRINREDLV